MAGSPPAQIPGPAGPSGPVGPIGPQGPQGITRDIFAGSGVTDSNGNLTFTFSPPFAMVPDCVATVQSTLFVSKTITALSVSSCTVNVKQSAAITILGIGVLAAGAPLAGATVHLTATVPGRTS